VRATVAVRMPFKIMGTTKSDNRVNKVVSPNYIAILLPIAFFKDFSSFFTALGT